MQTKAPKIHPITQLPKLRYEQYTLANGVPVYEVRSGTLEVIKLELVFKAGRWYEQHKLQARATALMLREGTASFNSKQISELTDFYGATFRIDEGFDTVSISIYCLKKHLGQLLPLLGELLSAPQFPQQELVDFSKRSRQRLLVDLEKNDTLAYRQFTELLYGPSHPYGYNSFPENYDLLPNIALKPHFDAHYHAGNCFVLLAGHIDDEIRQMVAQCLETNLAKSKPALQPSHEVSCSAPSLYHTPRPDSQQAALRLGRPLFGRHHPDYHGMYVLNTLLGGYFGSRLMTNLREDNGFTYGIYSSLDTMLQGGYFMIGAEVGHEVKDAALTEIFKEVQQLRDEPADKEELEMVRNYLMGQFLTALDGPFNTSEVLKELHLHGFNHQHIEELAETVLNIQPQQLQHLAQQYLDPESFITVAVGG